MQNLELTEFVRDRVPDATASEIISVVPRAVRKNERIIEREGDAGGIRRSCEYLAHLIIEEVISARATKKSALQMQ